MASNLNDILMSINQPVMNKKWVRVLSGVASLLHLSTDFTNVTYFFFGAVLLSLFKTSPDPAQSSPSQGHNFYLAEVIFSVAGNHLQPSPGGPCLQMSRARTVTRARGTSEQVYTEPGRDMGALRGRGRVGLSVSLLPDNAGRERE